MNIVIANRLLPMLQSLNIDVMQTLNGQFEVDDIVGNFKNVYYNRIILDITAIKNYQDIRTLQKLALSLDMNKVILVLDESATTNFNGFLSSIVSIGIYNFTKNNHGVLNLLERPNSYGDVAHYQQFGMTNNQTNNSSIDKNLVGLAPTKIIGFKNLTPNAGATTLTYLAKTILSKYYNVIAIELDKNDFKYFKDDELISINDDSIALKIAQNSDKEAILIDLNDNKNALELCHEVIYLIEPSIRKLNQFLYNDNKKLQNFRDKKVILNRCTLDINDIKEFEFESNLNFFHVISNINDRLNIQPKIEELLIKLGFNRIK